MMKAKDIMYVGEKNPSVLRTTCFREVLEEMNSKHLGAVSVIDNGKLVGIITDGDVRRLILKTQSSLPDLFLTEAEKIMIINPKTISPDSALKECLELLEKFEFWVLPVVDKKNTLLGMVHMHTLLKAMVNQKLS